MSYFTLLVTVSERALLADACLQRDFVGNVNCKGFSHLFSDIIVTGVYTVSEQVFCAAITAAEVTVVEELSARSEG